MHGLNKVWSWLHDGGRSEAEVKKVKPEEARLAAKAAEAKEEQLNAVKQLALDWKDDDLFEYVESRKDTVRRLKEEYDIIAGQKESRGSPD